MADIYTVNTTLDPGEAFSKVKKLPKGKYKYVLIRTTGDEDDITLEAELETGGTRVKKYNGKCTAIVTEVGFEVENDNDIWEITVSNSSSSNGAKVTSKLSKM